MDSAAGMAGDDAGPGRSNDSRVGNWTTIGDGHHLRRTGASRLRQKDEDARTRPDRLVRMFGSLDDPPWFDLFYLCIDDWRVLYPVGAVCFQVGPVGSP